MATSKQRAWSFSALNNYETCPKKFWHLSIQKDYTEVEGEALLYGKRVHKSLEKLVKYGTALPSDLQHMMPMVQPFIDAPVPKKAEQQLAITHELQPCGWKDWQRAWCRAMIDLSLFGESSATIIDYKTGAMKDDGFSQLGLAAVVFMLHYAKIERVNAGYLWLAEGGQLSSQTFHRAAIPEILNEILPRVKKFQTAFETSDYPPNPSGLCRNHCCITGCPYHGG